MEEIRARIQTLKNDKYRVDSILGAGGFGITYRCTNMDTGETCAIKEYMPEAIADRDQSGSIVPEEGRKKAYLHGKERFLEEADILMKMDHIPSVVHVWESFEENNTAYYVMEFLQGKTLKQVTRAMGGKLPFYTACEAVIKAGTALDMVHRQAGIFHRDISPENLMVMPDGEIKIIDFGSAKSMSISENQQFSVVLKPGFAPPEQYASNMSQGSFTDVYAMAGTFYYIASGTMIPASPERLMGANMEALNHLVPECSVETAKAVEAALNLDPKFRTQTMWEFIDEIKSSTRWKEPENVQKQQKQHLEAYCEAPSDHPEATITTIEDTETEFIQPDAWIRVICGASYRKDFPLEANVPVTVGRSPIKSQYVIEGHPEISGLHFQLIYMPQKQGFYIIDESTNGLFYKGIRLEKGKKYKIFPGDEIGVGSMQCVITVEVNQI